MFTALSFSFLCAVAEVCSYFKRYSQSSQQSNKRHRGDPGSRTGQSTWHLWWTESHRDSFFSQVLRFSPVSIIPPLLQTHSCIVWGWTVGPLAAQFRRAQLILGVFLMFGEEYKVWSCSLCSFRTSSLLGSRTCHFR
jgi:hypothetical protein